MCYGCNGCNECGKFDDTSLKPKFKIPIRCPKCYKIVAEEDDVCPRCGMVLQKNSQANKK